MESKLHVHQCEKRRYFCLKQELLSVVTRKTDFKSQILSSHVITLAWKACEAFIGCCITADSEQGQPSAMMHLCQVPCDTAVRSYERSKWI